LEKKRIVRRQASQGLSIQYKTILPILLIITIFMLGVSYYTYRQVERSVQHKGESTVEIIRIAMENAITARKTAEDVMEKEMLSQAVLASYIVRDPAIKFPQVAELAQRAGIDEVWVTDATGQVVLTNAGEKIDFHFGSDPKGQAFEFMQLITAGKKSIAQPAQQRTIDPKVYKYVGVGGWSTPAIVQVGRDGQILTKLEEQVGAKPLIDQLKNNMGSDVLFAAIVSKDHKVLHSTSKELEELGEIKQLMADGQDKATLDSTISGLKATLHFAQLSNGQAVIVALSGEVLSSILSSSFIATVIGLIIIAAAVYLIIHMLTRRLRDLQSAMGAISQGQGDLTQRLPVGSQDEIGMLAVSFNQFSDTIQSIVAEVQMTARQTQVNAQEMSVLTEHTTTVSGEIGLSMNEIATAASRQASEVEGGMKSIHDIARLIQETEGQARDLDEKNVQIQHDQQVGTEAVRTLEHNMSEYKLRASEVSSNLSSLMSDIDGITEMAGTIQAISRQTGLLALNASIEAARAGEHGKGFSVVAAEVRKLSEQSTAASDRIQEILQIVIQSTERTKSVMALAGTTLLKQSDSVEHTSSAFYNIENSLQSMSQRIETIKGMTQAMSGLKDSLVSFIETASAITEETAAGSQEVLANVESQLLSFQNMSEKAKELQAMMSKLTGAVERFQV
jgi:methyl-accepting chemotaxis protein